MMKSDRGTPAGDLPAMGRLGESGGMLHTGHQGAGVGQVGIDMEQQLDSQFCNPGISNQEAFDLRQQLMRLILDLQETLDQGRTVSNDMSDRGVVLASARDGVINQIEQRGEKLLCVMETLAKLTHDTGVVVELSEARRLLSHLRAAGFCVAAK
jgi:hypothetical protein